MTTKVELEDRIKVLEAAIAELERQLAEKNALLGTKESQAGFLVSTPNPNYSGVTSGVMFNRGKAFLPADEPGNEQKVLVLINDFGYQVEKVGSNGKG